MADVMVPIIPWNEITLETKLGEGGFGIVYQGNWKHGGTVAIKQIKGTLGTDATQELKAEAGAIARLNSPYVIRLFGLCWEQDRYAMVMELMPNASLYHLLHNGKELPWNLRYHLAQDIAYGLRLLHARNILHRDLKSLNVLLDTNFRAKLTDFGLAKVKTQSRTTSKAVASVGTIAWMAPELFGLKPQYSTASDVYAYALTAWELASRETPYKDVADREEIKSAIKGGEREDIPTDCPETFASLIQACWHQVPGKRPTMDMVVSALEQIIAKEAPQTTVAAAPVAVPSPGYQDASLSTVGMVTAAPAATASPSYQDASQTSMGMVTQVVPAVVAPQPVSAKAKKTKQEKPGAPKKEKEHKPSIWERLSGRKPKQPAAASVAPPAAAAPQPVNPSPSAPIEEIVLPPFPPREQVGEPIAPTALGTTITPAYSMSMAPRPSDPLQDAFDLINSLPVIKGRGWKLSRETRDMRMAFTALEYASDYSDELDRYSRGAILDADEVLRPYFRQIRDSSGQSTTHIRQPTTTSLPEVNYVAPSVMDAPALYVPTMQLDQVQYALNIINALPPMKEQGLVLTKESRDWEMVFGALEDAFTYSRKLTIEAQDVILKALEVLHPYFNQIQKRRTALSDSTAPAPRPIAM